MRGHRANSGENESGQTNAGSGTLAYGTLSPDQLVLVPSKRAMECQLSIPTVRYGLQRRS
jgi:hypothetical protein